MAVVKQKDMDWKDYARKLAESAPNKISDIELLEFSGYLLRRDMEESNDRLNIFATVMRYDNCFLADLMASFLIAESPDTNEDLVKHLKEAVLEYYMNEIKYLIRVEKEAIAEERRLMKENPNDEYNPDLDEDWGKK